MSYSIQIWMFMIYLERGCSYTCPRMVKVMVLVEVVYCLSSLTTQFRSDNYHYLLVDRSRHEDYAVEDRTRMCIWQSQDDDCLRQNEIQTSKCYSRDENLHDVGKRWQSCKGDAGIRKYRSSHTTTIFTVTFHISRSVMDFYTIWALWRT